MSIWWIYKNQTKTCKKKLKYRSYEEADKVAESYNQRVLFADMQAYWCERHGRWHIGHSYKNLRNARRIFDFTIGEAS
jgi:hypothetical protein